MSKITGLVVIGFLIIGGVLLYNQKKPAMQPEPKTETMTQSISPMKEFTMTAKQWSFDPATITVKKGDKVRLKIKNIDVTHGFALPDFGVRVDLIPDKEETIEFTADKKGEYTFFCSVMCGEGHKDMVGKLIVE